MLEYFHFHSQRYSVLILTFFSKVSKFYFSAIMGILSCFFLEQDRCPSFFFGSSTFYAICFSKFQNILSLNNYGHSVLFLTEQDRMPNFFLSLNSLSYRIDFFFKFQNVLFWAFCLVLYGAG